MASAGCAFVQFLPTLSPFEHCVVVIYKQTLKKPYT